MRLSKLPCSHHSPAKAPCATCIRLTLSSYMTAQPCPTSPPGHYHSRFARILAGTSAGAAVSCISATQTSRRRLFLAVFGKDGSVLHKPYHSSVMPSPCSCDGSRRPGFRQSSRTAPGSAFCVLLPWETCTLPALRPALFANEDCWISARVSLAQVSCQASAAQPAPSILEPPLLQGLPSARAHTARTATATGADTWDRGVPPPRQWREDAAPACQMQHPRPLRAAAVQVPLMAVADHVVGSSHALPE